MKSKLLTISFLSGLLLSAVSSAGQFRAADDSVISDICVAALSGNRAELYSKIRSLGYNRNFISEKVLCNETPLLSFVEQHGKNSDAVIRMMQPRSFTTSIRDVAMYHHER